jgi:hypothetical protein
MHLRLFTYSVYLEYTHYYNFNNVCSTLCNSHTQLDGESCRHVPCEVWFVDVISSCTAMLTVHIAQVLTVLVNQSTY